MVVGFVVGFLVNYFYLNIEIGFVKNFRGVLLKLLIIMDLFSVREWRVYFLVYGGFYLYFLIFFFINFW